jgi:alkylation response protein AidB-like acyl-CoA dehydrogenase
MSLAARRARLAHGVALSADEALFLDVVDALVEREVAPLAAAIDATDAFPEAARAVLADNDLLALGLPEAAGGSGARLPLILLVVERIAEASPAVAALLAATHACAAALVVGDGPASAEVARLAERGLPTVCDGLGASIASTANTGSLVATPDDAGWRLDGTLARVDNAVASDALVVLAHGLDDEPVVLWVPVPAEGLAIEGPRRRTGLRGVLASALRFEGCRVAREGYAGGAAAAVAAQQVQRLCVGAAALGVGRAALARATDYTAERHQFGAPLASFGAIRMLLAAMAMRAQAAAAALYAVALGPDALTADAVPAGVGAVRLATTAAVETSVDAVQLHGGYGYVRELPVERLLRDAVSLRARAGGRAAAIHAGA